MAKYTLEQLINDSVQVYTGMIAVWPQYEKEETIDFDIATFNRSYASNNGILAFVTDGKLYVTPSTRRAYAALSGFSQKYFYVPFSNGDYPKNEQYRWNQLRAMQDSQLKECFIQDCIDYCEEHHIGELDDDTLARCLELPASGVHVKHAYYEEVIYPTFAGHFFDCFHLQEMLGTYCTNNGRVAFIYRDGRTFVTKDYEILKALRATGYKKGSLFVPFSNGEEIQDYALRMKWEAIKE